MPQETAPELVAVTGIGETYADVLVEVGVRDAGELARQDADDLARRLADAGHAYGAQRVGGWIDEARRVIAGTGPEQEAGQHIARAGAAPEAPAADTSRERGDGEDPESDQLAAFTVFFDRGLVGGEWRTRVYHEESGEELTLEGIDLPALLRFMLVDALSSTADAVPEPFRAAARRALDPPVQPDVARSVDGVEVSIGDVDVGVVSTPQGRVEPWLEVVVPFDVAGLDVGDDVEAAYLCEVLLIDRANGKLRTIVSRYGPLDHGDGAYRASQELPLPQVGDYDIETVVLLFPPIEAVACRRGPPLSITP